MARTYIKQSQRNSNECLTQGCHRTDFKGRGLCVKCYDKWIKPIRTARWRRKQQQHLRRQIKAKLCTYYRCPNSPLPNHRRCSLHLSAPKTTPEYRTVAAHLQFIRQEKSTYKNMPFFSEWNPQHGGSIRAGELWILNNLGKRPTDGKWELHIVDRAIGFMPNNLRWVPCQFHKREEFVNRIYLENQNLRKELERLQQSTSTSLNIS